MAVESASATIVTLRTQLHARMQELRAATNAHTVMLFCYDGDSDRFLLPLSLGLFDTASFDKDMPRTDRLAGKIVKESCRIVVEEVETHPDVNGPFSRRERIKSSAGLPSALNDETVGLAFISNCQHHLFREGGAASDRRFCSGSRRMDCGLANDGGTLLKLTADAVWRATGFAGNRGGDQQRDESAGGDLAGGPQTADLLRACRHRCDGGG